MNSRRLQVRVVRKFQEGWLCAEAVAGSVLEHLGLESQPELRRAISAFNYGLGGTGLEHCGAFTGGVLALGVLFGRDQPDLELRVLKTEIENYRRWFIETFGTLSCSELRDSFGETKESECGSLSVQAVVWLSHRIEQRQPAVKVGDFNDQSRLRVKLGQCPFASHS
ncbi:MAG: C-GCAxxG-C-C family protein [Proteobacteria bacterium]|nr:C-GCAxxG-C-C family protein [Pseudomonadota bacterium]MBU1612276.1 C-GCAxxG-C-C family protein [Pseudomonadota bacterium]